MPTVSLQPPSSGPPAAWVREHGATEGCQACRNVLDGRKASRSHVVRCMRRYALWLRDSLSPEGAGQEVGVGAGAPLPSPVPTTTQVKT